MPDCACLLYILTNAKWWLRAAACTTLLQFCVWRVWLLCKRRCPHHRHRCVLWVDRQMDRANTLQWPHCKMCKKPPHLARLVDYEIHYVQTCTSASTYAYTSSWGCYIGGGGKGAQREGEGERGKEEARREREQEVVWGGGTKMWP